MNSTVVFALAVATVLSVTSADDEESTGKYYNHYLENTFSSERMYKKILKCLLDADDTDCSSMDKELRYAIPEALTDDCSKCTEKQKSQSEQLIKYLQENKPDDWAKILAKWDPQGIYMQKYENKLSS